MTAMWKPGTAKPKHKTNGADRRENDGGSTTAASTATSSNHPHNNTAATSSDKQSQQQQQQQQQPAATKQSKKLSGATMGMRFMQRKSLDGSKQNIKTHTSTTSATTAASAFEEANTRNPTAPSTTDKFSGTKRDSSNITTSSSSTTSFTESNNNNKVLIQTASVTDIYGPHSDIIGRRSFNNFHKCIAVTWDESYRKRCEYEKTTFGGSGEKTAKKISDEELLKRYQMYVNNGRGKKRDGGEERRKRKAAA